MNWKKQKKKRRRGGDLDAAELVSEFIAAPPPGNGDLFVRKPLIAACTTERNPNKTPSKNWIQMDVCKT